MTERNEFDHLNAVYHPPLPDDWTTADWTDGEDDRQYDTARKVAAVAFAACAIIYLGWTLWG